MESTTLFIRRRVHIERSPAPTAPENHESKARPEAIALNGWILGLSAASLISLTNLFSHLHFEAGSNPVTFLLFRYLLVVAALVVILRSAGRPMRIEKPYWRPVLIAGFLSSAGAACLAFAIDLIAISLAIIILYLFPLLTLLLSSLLQRRRPSVVMTLGLLVAFAGLVLAVGPDSDNADPAGIVFAFCAALCIASSFVWTERTLGALSDGTRLLGLTGTGLLLAIGLAVFTQDLVWPLPSPDGWSTLLAATATFGAAFAAMFMSLARIGASATAMLMNLEPPLTAILAVTLLGDVLNGIQVLGILVVVGAVAFVQWHTRRAAQSSVRAPESPR